MDRPRIFMLATCTLLATPSLALILGRAITPGGCERKCEYDYEPLCANDGFTYPNYCIYSIEACKNTSLEIVRNRPCTVPDPCLYVCNRESDPVCGNNGLTYPNPCILMFNACFYASQGIKPRHKGACVVDQNKRIRPPCPKFCTRIYEPVCGSDGRTYANICRLDSVTCRDPFIVKDRDGPCDEEQDEPQPPASSRCPLGCTREFLPICGSDGKTYNNMCLLNMTACKDPTVFAVSEGPCKAPSDDNDPPPVTRSPQCPKGCTREYLPVCATDSQTYNNMCLFDMAACKDPSLKVIYEGRCDITDFLFWSLPFTRAREQRPLTGTQAKLPSWLEQVFTLGKASDGLEPERMMSQTLAMRSAPLITRLSVETTGLPTQMSVHSSQLSAETRLSSQRSSALAKSISERQEPFFNLMKKLFLKCA